MAMKNQNTGSCHTLNRSPLASLVGIRLIFLDFKEQGEPEGLMLVLKENLRRFEALCLDLLQEHVPR